MLDNRFPWMCRIEDAPICPTDKKRASRFLRAVSARTGINGCFNRRSGGLFLYYGATPDHGPIEVPFMGSTKWQLNSTDIDDVVRALQYGHRTRGEKVKQQERGEREEAYNKTVSDQQFLDDNRKGAEEIAGFLDRKRRGVGKVSATVE